MECGEESSVTYYLQRVYGQEAWSPRQMPTRGWHDFHEQEGATLSSAAGEREVTLQPHAGHTGAALLTLDAH